MDNSKGKHSRSRMTEQFFSLHIFTLILATSCGSEDGTLQTTDVQPKQSILGTSGTLYAGMNVTGNSLEEVADVQALGVSTVRVNHASATPSIVQSYHQAGLKVLMVLDGNLNGGSSDPAGFAMQAGSVAQEYYTSYGNSVDAYEIWNEEDNKDLDAKPYAALLSAACTQIKRVTSFGAKVVMGGFFKSDPTYLASVIAAMADYDSCVDAVAFHLYEDVTGCGTGTCTSFSNGDLNLAVLAGRMIAASRGKPVMLTEWGTRGSTDQTCLRSNIQDFFQTAIKGTGLDSAYYFKWRSENDLDYTKCSTFLSDEVSLVNSTDEKYSHKMSWSTWQTFRHN